MRMFFTEKEIVSKDGVLHFRRYAILSCRWFNVYIHRIFKSDSDKYLHDHPWNYFSIVLWGRYVERSVDNLTMLSPGSIARNKAERFHKIELLLSKSVTTLFITGRRKREWGYDIGRYWVHNDYYRKNKDIHRLLNNDYVIDIKDKVILNK